MVLKTSAYDSLSYAVIIELYFWIKISEGYTTLQNNVTKKDPLEYKGMYTGGKAAGFEQKKDGNKAPNSSRQPREVSGNEGTVAREGTGLAAWMWERTQILPPVEPSSSCPSSSAVQRDFNQKPCQSTWEHRANSLACGKRRKTLFLQHLLGSGMTTFGRSFGIIFLLVLGQLV